MPTKLLCAAGLGLLALTTNGCSRLTVVGVSDWAHESREATGKPSHATEIIATRNELLKSPLPALGDIDGDGFDDFIVMSSPELPVPASGTACLFYGRPDFPEQLTVQQADATFSSGALSSSSLGDINGDGYNDFALLDPAGIELIFGGPERLSGHHSKLTTGKVVWKYMQKELSALNQTTQIEWAVKLGDTNADGYDDFALRLSEEASDDKNVFGAVGIIINDYVILGRHEDWPSGVWDPSWAVARFGKDPGESLEQYSQLIVSAGGDFDGDGLYDILAQGWDRYWLFYGSAQGWEGVLTPDNADAELHFGKDGSPFVIGDLDADGATDIAVPWTNDLRIFYGPHQRWSGRVEPQADLTFYDQGSYYNAVVADLDSDQYPDLLFFGNAETMHLDEWSDLPQHRVVYRIKGSGQRLTGRMQLTRADVYAPIGYPAPPVLDGGGFTMDYAGDLDGDGSSDLVVSAAEPEASADSYVVLLPGAARAPD